MAGISRFCTSAALTHLRSPLGAGQPEVGVIAPKVVAAALFLVDVAVYCSVICLTLMMQEYDKPRPLSPRRDTGASFSTRHTSHVTRHTPHGTRRKPHVKLTRFMKVPQRLFHPTSRGTKLSKMSRKPQTPTYNHKPQSINRNLHPTTTNHKPQTIDHIMKPTTTIHNPRTTNHKPQTTNHKTTKLENHKPEASHEPQHHIHCASDQHSSQSIASSAHAGVDIVVLNLGFGV